MHLDFAMLCQAAEIDSTGKLSMLGGGFDTIEVPALPAMVGPFVLVAKFVGVQAEVTEKHFFALAIVNPLGERTELGESRPVPMPKLPENQEKSISSTALARIQLQFLNAGRYGFEVKLDESVVRTIPLYVELNPAVSE